MKKVIALIPAKRYSRRLAGKNMRPLCRHPLSYYSVRAAQLSEHVDQVFVSSDSEQVLDFAKSLKAGVIKRPEALCMDDVPNFEVMRHAVDTIETQYKYTVDLLLLLQPTNPFRTPTMIDHAVRLIVDDPHADSLITVKTSKAIIGEKQAGYWNPQMDNLPHRLSHGRTYSVLQGNIFIFRPERTLKKGFFLGRNIIPFELDDDLIDIDIDTAKDFAMAECYLERNMKKFGFFFK